MQVKEISARDVLRIRKNMLRPDHPEAQCVFDGDNDESTFHLGAFIDKNLVSIASFYFEKNDVFEITHQYRLRGMATTQEFQGKGLGKSLIKTALPIIKRNQVNTLWCNARSAAVGFYENIGFNIESAEFEIPQIGPHYLMKLEI